MPSPSKQMDMFVTKPAILAAVSYLVMVVIILLPLGVTDKSAPKYSFGKRVLLVIILLIPIALSIYSVNCMMVGGCVVWSWVNGVAIAAWVLLFVLATLMLDDDPSEVIMDS